MKRLMIVIACAACQGNGGSKPTAGSGSGSAIAAPVAPPPSKLHVSCAPAKLPPHATIDMPPPPPPPKQPPAKPEPQTIDDAVRGLGAGGGHFRNGAIIGQGAGLSRPPLDPYAPYGLGRHDDPQLPLVVTAKVTPDVELAEQRKLERRDHAKYFACYRKTIHDRATVTVHAAIGIGPDGKITASYANGGGDPLDTCIDEIVRGEHYVAKRGGFTSFELTLKFTAAAGDPPPAPPKAERVAVALPPPKPAPVEHVADTREWTPYAASEGLAPDDIATTAATELTTAIGTRTAKLESCFGESTAAVRAIVRVAFDGGVTSARAGGAGDSRIETCIGAALIGLRVSAPPIVAEVACDLVRGDPQPWRVTLDAGYTVLEVTAKGVLHGGKPVDPAAPPKSDAETTFVLVAAPDVPGAAIDNAITLASESSATLVAIRTDKGAPMFVGMATDGRSLGPTGEPPGARSIDLDPKDVSVFSCVGGHMVGMAARRVPDALDVLFTSIRNECVRQGPCASVVAIGLGGTSTGEDLATIAAAAGRAKLDRIAIGDDLPCPRK